jgi:hypothetical protein
MKRSVEGNRNGEPRHEAIDNKKRLRREADRNRNSQTVGQRKRLSDRHIDRYVLHSQTDRVRQKKQLDRQYLQSDRQSQSEKNSMKEKDSLTNKDSRQTDKQT